MAACNAAGRHQQSLAVFSALLASGRAPTTAALSSAVTAHCRLGDAAAAWGVLQEMAARGCDRTHATFMAVLHAAERRGAWRVAADVLDAMGAAGARVTPQAYAAAVSACAAAGELEAARALTAKLGGGGGAASSSSAAAGGGSGSTGGSAGRSTPQQRDSLAAPAHMLVGLHDKGCDWAAAARVVADLEAAGVRPDAQTLGALASALWASGGAAGCLAALKVFEGACAAGKFRLELSVDEARRRVRIALPAAGPGMAAAGLWRLLQQLAARVGEDGAGILRESVLLTIGQDGDRADARVHEVARLVRAPDRLLLILLLRRLPLSCVRMRGCFLVCVPRLTSATRRRACHI